LGLVAFGALAVASAPAAAIVGGVLVVGTLAYGAVTIVKNGVEIGFADSSQEVKENLRDLGSAVGVTAMAAPFAPKGVQGIKSGLSVLMTEASGAPKVTGLAGYINRNLAYLDRGVEGLKEMARHELSSEMINFNSRNSATYILGVLAVRSRPDGRAARKALLELYFQDTSEEGIAAMYKFIAILKKMPPTDQAYTFYYLPRARAMASKISVDTSKKLQYLQTVFSKANYWDSMLRPPSAASYDLTRILETIGAVYRDQEINLTLAERIEIVDQFLEAGDIGCSVLDVFFYREFHPALRVFAKSPGTNEERARLLLEVRKYPAFFREKNELLETVKEMAEQGFSLDEILEVTGRVSEMVEQGYPHAAILERLRIVAETNEAIPL
jgi:hypothetical protein